MHNKEFKRYHSFEDVTEAMKKAMDYDGHAWGPVVHSIWGSIIDDWYLTDIENRDKKYKLNFLDETIEMMEKQKAVYEQVRRGELQDEWNKWKQSQHS